MPRAEIQISRKNQIIYKVTLPVQATLKDIAEQLALMFQSVEVMVTDIDIHISMNGVPKVDR